MGFLKKIIKKSPVAKIIKKDPIAKSTTAGKAIQKLTSGSSSNASTASKTANSPSSAFYADQSKVAAPRQVNVPTVGKVATRVPALSKLASTLKARSTKR